MYDSIHGFVMKMLVNFTGAFYAVIFGDAGKNNNL